MRRATTMATAMKWSGRKAGSWQKSPTTIRTPPTSTITKGFRTKKTLSDGSYILYDIVDGVYVGETRYNANGSVSVYIRYILDEGNSPVGISLWYPATGGWTDYHFVKNLQGDVLEVYKVSDGSLAASYTYDSWGNILSQSGSLASINPFRYRSYYYDTKTWFYYLQSRYYDPAIGRFLNADSFASTGQGILGNNMFAYCSNNPISTYDPTGTFPWHVVIGAGIGGSLSALGTGLTGGTQKEVALSGLRGALFGGLMAAVPSTAPYVIGVDVVWTVLEVWSTGSSVENGIVAGLIQLLASKSLVRTNSDMINNLVNIIFGTGITLTSSSLIEIFTKEKYYQEESHLTCSIQIPYFGGIGGGPQNVTISRY